MKRIISAFSLMIILSTFELIAQTTSDKANDANVKNTETKRELQLISSERSPLFLVSNISFNQKIDPKGFGELLDVNFEVSNKSDLKQDLYVFVIATYENDDRSINSFEMPKPNKPIIQFFKAVPEDTTLYENPSYNNGSIEKYIKIPKDYKAGINPYTGQPYHLVDKFFVYTNHLSEYRKDFVFFNCVTIAIYESDGTCAFRQQYSLKNR